jgi:pyrophosphatase PpaX
MPPSSRPAAVLFDLDGTLVDTIELLLSSVRHAFAEREARRPGGRAPTDAEWIAGIGTPLAAQLRPFARDDADALALVDSYRAYQREHHDRLTRCYADVVDVVTELRARGHPTAVVTSKADDIAHRTLAHVGLLPLMDLVVGVGATARHKPDPEPVLYALGRLDYAPAEALFVGDSPHDIRAGNAAGVATVAALWGPFSRDVLEAVRPTFTIARITELPGIVERIET